jgi:hypothetical protein
MKTKAVSLRDRVILFRRFIIETINDRLKNISQIEHSCHRSPNGFTLNMLAGLVAYYLNISDLKRNAMAIA